MFFDSIGKMNPSLLKEYGQILAAFLQNELINKKNLDKMLASDDLPILNPVVPAQTADYDCGIFMLHNVELFLKVGDRDADETSFLSKLFFIVII